MGDPSNLIWPCFIFDLYKKKALFLSWCSHNGEKYSCKFIFGIVFITTDQIKDKRTIDKIPDEEIGKRLLVHEYGHTVQSIIFGPMYLLVMGIPSMVWGFLPYFVNKRKKGISYFSFFTERFANYLGEKATKEKSMEYAVL